jgi:hypothetical protein
MIHTSSYQKLSLKSKIYNKVCKNLPFRTYLPSDKFYEITISEDKKFLWYIVPKVSTRTIIEILLKNDIQLVADSVGGVFHPPAYYRDYFKFAFVRNPWDRLISCWKDKIFKVNHFQFSESEREQMKNLETYLHFISKQDLNNSATDHHIILQSKLIDLNNVDFIGRYENILDDLTFVCSKVVINNIEIPWKNKSNREFNSYRNYYDNNTAAMVAKLYEKDIRMFGYSF